MLVQQVKSIGPGQATEPGENRNPGFGFADGYDREAGVDEGVNLCSFGIGNDCYFRVGMGGEKLVDEWRFQEVVAIGLHADDGELSTHLFSYGLSVPCTRLPLQLTVDCFSTAQTREEQLNLN